MTSITLDDFQRVLTIIGTLIGIFAGIVTLIVQLRKMPGWHLRVAEWVISLSPIIFFLLGVYLLYEKHPFAASIVFMLAFLCRLYIFHNSKRDITRSDVLWFGVECVNFTLMQVFCIFSALIDIVLRQTSVMQKMIETIEKLVK